MTWLNYIHTYIHTCTSLPSPVLSVSMRDGVVVGYLLMKQDGWIGCSSGMIIGLLPNREPVQGAALFAGTPIRRDYNKDNTELTKTHAKKNKIR